MKHGFYVMNVGAQFKSLIVFTTQYVTLYVRCLVEAIVEIPVTDWQQAPYSVR